jgi:hypothetical protein
MVRKRNFLAPIICGSLLLPIQTLADQDLADEFVVLLRYGNQFDEQHEQCLATAKKIPPESLLAAEPDKFYGIRPGSKCWPKVVEAYNQYYATLCSKPSRDDFLKALAATYRARLSEGQLKKAIEFYSSDVGAELISAHKSAATNVAQVVYQAQADLAPQAVADLDRRLQAIVDGKSSERSKE